MDLKRDCNFINREVNINSFYTVFNNIFEERVPLIRKSSGFPENFSVAAIKLIREKQNTKEMEKLFKI